VRVEIRQWSELVAAAQAGEPAALDELVAAYLPLVYNIVGRALDGHLDVDDVVQETMLRAVNGLDGLRDPESFRSWLVAIAMRQVRDRARDRRGTALAVLDEERDRADPGADFVDLTILRLHLEGQRQEVAEATRWLDEDDRQLLSLWWLEVAGELTRRELATALELTPQHAAVRVQRLKAQLEAARSVVRALYAVPRCYELASLTLEWDGRPSPLWRKRLARHTRACPDCGGTRPDLVPAERLLVGLALVPLPVGFAIAWQLLPGAAAAYAAAAHVAGTGLAKAGLAKAGLLQVLLKPAVVVTAGVTLAAGGAVVAYETSHSAGRPLTRAAAAPSPSVVSTHAQAAPASAKASPSPSPTPSPSSLYGTVVDLADTAPAKDAVPAALPRRPEGTLVNSAGHMAVMQWAGNTVTLTGQGYFRVRWQLSTTRKGTITMPTWTGLKGKLFHVASGGGVRMDEHGAWPGFSVPAGAQQMWQNEYYYVDGEVTLHQNETSAVAYGITIQVMNWDNVNADINTGPPGVLRYGLVRDTGGDDAPVPQYLTRSAPADQSTVPQLSQVTAS
jgi:RNA polymerase sigma factor (sigma-70 family)